MDDAFGTAILEELRNLRIEVAGFRDDAAHYNDRMIRHASENARSIKDGINGAGRRANRDRRIGDLEATV